MIENFQCVFIFSRQSRTKIVYSWQPADKIYSTAYRKCFKMFCYMQLLLSPFRQHLFHTDERQTLRNCSMWILSQLWTATLRLGHAPLNARFRFRGFQNKCNYYRTSFRKYVTSVFGRNCRCISLTVVVTKNIAILFSTFIPAISVKERDCIQNRCEILPHTC